MSNSPEDKLRRAELDGSEAPEAVDHLAKHRKPGELHLDDEKDSLFDDGLEVEDESLTLAGTQGNPNKS